MFHSLAKSLHKVQALLPASALLVAMSSATYAHNLSFEPQAIDDKPWKSTKKNYSLATPRIIPLPQGEPLEEGMQGQFPTDDDSQNLERISVLQSRAIYAYLDPDDIDVYQFNLSASDISYWYDVEMGISPPPLCRSAATFCV